MSGALAKAPVAEVRLAEVPDSERLHELVCTLMFGINPPPCGMELIYDAYLAQKKETI